MAFPAFQERLRQLFRRAKFDGGAVSRSTPVVEVVQKWNNPNEAFTGIKLNISDSASASGSLLADLQVGGVSKFGVRKNGQVYASKVGEAYGIEVNEFCIPYGGCSHTVNTQPVLFTNAFTHRFQYYISVGWTAGYASAELDTAFYRNAAGVVEINNGTSGTFRDLKLRNLIGIGSLTTGIAAKTANYTSTPDDGTLTFDATSGALVNTLETAVGANGRIKVIVKIDASANTVTIDPNGAETINGAATLVLSTRWDKAVIQSDGANWIRIA